MYSQKHTFLDCFFTLVYIYFVIVLAVFYTDLHFGLTRVHGPAKLGLLADFKAAAPFQTRIFIPAVVHWLKKLFSINVYYGFYYSEMIGWILLFITGFKSLDSFRFSRNRFLQCFTSITIAIPLYFSFIIPIAYLDKEIGSVVICKQLFYPADIYTAFFSLAVYLILKQLSQSVSIKLIIYYFLIFFLSSINRETSFLYISFFFFSLRKSVSIQTLLRLVVMQIIIYLAIRCYIYLNFSDVPNPKGNIGQTNYEFQILYSFQKLSTAYYFRKVLFCISSGGIFLYLLFIGLLNLFNKLCSLVYVLPAFVMCLIFGVIDETRVFSEVVPLLWVFMVQAVSTRTEENISASS